VPTLRNLQHETFAQELATSKTADAAYVLAGYRANRSNAARLSANQDIQKRVAEIFRQWAQSVLQSPSRL
jgi:phage terminase small subunit